MHARFVPMHARRLRIVLSVSRNQQLQTMSSFPEIATNPSVNDQDAIDSLLRAAGHENVFVNVQDVVAFVRSDDRSMRIKLLNKAAQNGHVSFLSQMLCRVSKSNDYKHFLQEALFSAAVYSQKGAIDCLLSRSETDINFITLRGTALSAACGAGAKNIGIVRHLVAKGADVNLCREDGAFLPLEIASNRQADPEIFRQLIAMDAEVTDPRILCNVVQRCGEFQFILNQLTQMTIDIDAPLKNGDRPLGLALRADNVHNVRELLRAGANISAICFGGKTALGYAAQCRRHLVSVLLEYKPDVNVKDNSGNTALQYCYGAAHCVKLLVNAGATITQKIVDDTPISWDTHSLLKKLFEEQQRTTSSVKADAFAKGFAAFQRDDQLWEGKKLGETVSLAKTEEEALARALSDHC